MVVYRFFFFFKKILPKINLFAVILLMIIDRYVSFPGITKFNML